DSVQGIPLAGDNRGHVGAVSLAVAVPPAVVGSEPDLLAANGMAAKGDGRIRRRVRAVTGPGPIQPRLVYRAGHAAQGDRAAANVAQTANAGRNEIGMPHHITEMDVIRPNLFPHAANNAENANNGPQPTAVAPALDAVHVHSALNCWGTCVRHVSTQEHCRCTTARGLLTQLRNAGTGEVPTAA